MRLLAWFLLGLAVANAADVEKAIYENNFESAQVGSVPEDFLVLDGAFAVQQEGGGKFLELAGAPLETFGLVFGPTEVEGLRVSARIFGTSKGRRAPAFAVGLNGYAGYKLQLSPSKKLVELYRGDAVKATAPYQWESGQWTHFELQLQKSPEGWQLAGKVWPKGSAQPSAPLVMFSDNEQPPPGRPSIWGIPYSGTSIRFDDLRISRLPGKGRTSE